MKQTKNTNKKPRKPFPWRLFFCILLGAFIVADMVMIFCLSSENREASGNRSHGVTEIVVEIVVPDYNIMPPEQQAQKVEEFHPPVRKLAHFCIFGLLGVLTAAFMNVLNRGKRWLYWLIPTGFCLLYAISDEVHQIFTERGPAVTDVLIDFSGSLAGICVVNLICLWIICRARKRKAKSICE